MPINKILLVVCMLFFLSTNAQQKLNTFTVIDKETQQAIPYASVTIAKAKLSIATQKDGVFVIPGNLSVMKDTVVVDAQNYRPLKIPLNSLEGITKVQLERLPAMTMPAVLKKYSRTVTLNNYNPSHVGRYAGMVTEYAHFNYLQLAQLFSTDADHNHLVNIRINKIRGMMPTKFRIRIYDVDERTGGPGNDICDKIIDVDNFDMIEESTMGRLSSKKVIEPRFVEVDLKKAGIVIPVRKFYIAIEWLRDRYNRTTAAVYRSAADKFDSVQVYRPFIGISPIVGKKLNIWAMDFDHKWQPFERFAPFGTDLAIKLTIEAP